MVSGDANSNPSFNPFPEDRLLKFKSMEDEVYVFHTQQHPKRITVGGTDGRRYRLLLKPKDDLRKDARTMEFNAIVNRLLDHDSDARKRNLYIRTYVRIAMRCFTFTHY